MTKDRTSTELELFRAASTVWELGKAYPAITSQTAQATTALLDFIGALRCEQAAIEAARAAPKEVSTITVEPSQVLAPGEKEISKLYELIAAEKALSDYVGHVLQPQYDLCSHELWAIVGKLSEATAAAAGGDVNCNRHCVPTTVNQTIQ